MVGGFGFVTLASCLLVLSGCMEPKRPKVMLHHNGSWEAEQPAACPPMCHCYINILSCHPEMPLGSHAHGGFSSSSESAATTASSNWNATGTLTQVPTGIRGTMSGNVMTPFTVLDFRDNNISFIWKDNWLLFPRVEYLNLKGNRLTDLIPDTFEGLSLLKYLFLSYNSIRFIADYVFQPTPEIELIDISNNKLLAIQGDLFRTKHGLRFLKVLDLSNNDILILSPGAFSHLSSLHFLNISDNYLSLIGRGAFDKLNSVIYLDLRTTYISLDVLKSILESTSSIVNLYISHILKCCLCKFPQLNSLILTRNVEINCKNIFCTVTLVQCYTKEVKRKNILKDKERIIEEMKAFKAGTVSSLPGEKHTEAPQNKIIKLERSRNTDAFVLNSSRSQPEIELDNLNRNLQLGEKQSMELKEEMLNENTELADKLRSEESARNAQRENLKQINLMKLSSNPERPGLPDGGDEENTLDRVHKLKEALKSLYRYASGRIANNEQYRVKLES
ncbi:uncharacterized protein [Mobula birostris]|uniref:uncharacterized protein n=1 Tax=Mobula birostris TaxID=1983395 RepID=UPI003B284F06